MLYPSYPSPHPFLGFRLPSFSLQMDLLPLSFLLFSSGLELPSHLFSPLAGFSVHHHLTCWCPCDLLVQMVLTCLEIPRWVADHLFFDLLVLDALAPHAEEAQDA